MQKRFKIIPVIFMVLTIILTSCTSAAVMSHKERQSEDKVIELKLAHFFPATHPAETELVEMWSQAVEEATHGQVKIISYPGETLRTASDIYEGVINGVADMGLSCFAYTRGRFPVLEVFELPGIIYNNSKVASKVAWEGIKKLQPEEVMDTKLMMVLATGSGDLFTKVPVKNLDDLQGLEVRATGLSAKTLELLGGVPIAMAQSEAYEALSKGVVKGNLSPVEVLKGWKHAEVTDYLTKTPFLYNTLFFITMNIDKWNSLSPEIQKAIEGVNEEYHSEIAMGLWDKQNEAALKWAVEEMGMEVIELSEDEMALWISKVEPIQMEYVEEMDGKGLNGQEILDTVKKLADEYNKDY